MVMCGWKEDHGIVKMRGLTFDKARDVLPDVRNTFTMRVSPNGANLSLEFLGSGDDIFGEGVFCQLSKFWPFHQRRYLYDSIDQSQRIERQGQPTCRTNVIGG